MAGMLLAWSPRGRVARNGRAMLECPHDHFYLIGGDLTHHVEMVSAPIVLLRWRSHDQPNPSPSLRGSGISAGLFSRHRLLAGRLRSRPILLEKNANPSFVRSIVPALVCLKKAALNQSTSASSTTSILLYLSGDLRILTRMKGYYVLVHGRLDWSTTWWSPEEGDAFQPAGSARIMLTVPAMPTMKPQDFRMLYPRHHPWVLLAASSSLLPAIAAGEVRCEPAAVSRCWRALRQSSNR
jgi:hypothetical protein